MTIHAGGSGAPDVVFRNRLDSLAAMTHQAIGTTLQCMRNGGQRYYSFGSMRTMTRRAITVLLQGMWNLGREHNQRLMGCVARLTITALLQVMWNLRRHPSSRFMRVMTGSTRLIFPHHFHIHLRKIAGAGNKLGMA